MLRFISLLIGLVLWSSAALGGVFGTYVGIERSAAYIVQMADIPGLTILSTDYKSAIDDEGSLPAKNLNTILNATSFSLEIAKKSGQMITMDLLERTIIAEMAETLRISEDEAKTRFCKISEGTSCPIFSRSIAADVCRTAPETKP